LIKSFTRPGTITITFHVLIWSILILFPYLVSGADNDYKIGNIPGIFFTITGFIHAAIFYGNAFYLYPVLLNKRFWWLYILLSLLLIVGSFQMKYEILINWFPQVLKNTTAAKFVFGPSVAIFIISIIYRKVIDQIRLDRELKERRATQLETELKFLRSQINPHFLFNVLTNLVSLARKKSDKLEQSLIMLSELMRYTVYDAQGKKATLQKEIEYLNSYIELQKLRFGNDVKIDCSIKLDKEENDYTIEPMLLIPFVENAFKHGAGYSEQPWINISLFVKEGTMTFEVCNNYEHTSITGKDENSGIGISNVKSRLNLLYKGKYNLIINDKNNVFHIILTVILT
jgi:two-component system LytT family sensor kinase